MPICECGFNYVEAQLQGREVESYAVIHDKDYRRVIKKELAYLSERDKDKKGKLLANTSRWVGSLLHCPQCGVWMLSLPEKQSTEHEIVLLKTVRGTVRKPCKRKSTSGVT